MPAQLSWIVFPAIKPPLVLATYMPHAPPEMLLPTTLASLLARSGPKMVMPVSPERLMSLETILVPVESRITVPTTVLSVMSLETILVPVEPSSTIPTALPVKVLFATVVSMLSNAAIAAMPSGVLLTSLFTTLVRELSWTTMPSALVSGLPITWFFATVVLMLTTASIPPATLPMARFPTTVVLRAPRTSITNAVSSRLGQPGEQEPPVALSDITGAEVEEFSEGGEGLLGHTLDGLRQGQHAAAADEPDGRILGGEDAPAVRGDLDRPPGGIAEVDVDHAVSRRDPREDLLLVALEDGDGLHVAGDLLRRAGREDDVLLLVGVGHTLRLLPTLLLPAVELPAQPQGEAPAAQAVGLLVAGLARDANGPVGLLLGVVEVGAGLLAILDREGERVVALGQDVPQGGLLLVPVGVLLGGASRRGHRQRHHAEVGEDVRDGVLIALREEEAGVPGELLPEVRGVEVPSVGRHQIHAAEQFDDNLRRGAPAHDQLHLVAEVEQDRSVVADLVRQAVLVSSHGLSSLSL